MINCIFELHLSELLKEHSKKLRREAPEQYFFEIKEDSSFSKTQTRSHLPPKYCRSVTRRKSIENSLRKAYKTLTELTLLASDLKNMSPSQVKQYHQELVFLYIDFFFNVLLNLQHVKKSL